MEFKNKKLIISKEDWINITKKSSLNPYREVGPIEYKGWTFTAQLEDEDDVSKWHQEVISPSGEKKYINLSPYDHNQEELFKLWVDAGCPNADGKSIMGAMSKEDLKKIVNVEKKEALQQMDRLFGEAFSKKKIKFAKFNEFEKEGKDPLESPERELYEAAEDYEKSKTSPPYNLPKILDEIAKIKNIEIIKTDIKNSGVDVLIEFSDDKLYTITISPYKR